MQDESETVVASEDAFLGDADKFEEKEEALKRKAVQTGMTARRSNALAEQARWEENRLMMSNVVRKTQVRALSFSLTHPHTLPLHSS